MPPRFLFPDPLAATCSSAVAFRGADLSPSLRVRYLFMRDDLVRLLNNYVQRERSKLVHCLYFKTWDIFAAGDDTHFVYFIPALAAVTGGDEASRFC